MLGTATGLKSGLIDESNANIFFSGTWSTYYCAYNQISLAGSYGTKLIHKALGFYLLDQKTADKMVQISL